MCVTCNVLLPTPALSLLRFYLQQAADMEEALNTHRAQPAQHQTSVNIVEHLETFHKKVKTELTFTRWTDTRL